LRQVAVRDFTASVVAVAFATGTLGYFIAEE